jgi:hypothetical protein
MYRRNIMKDSTSIPATMQVEDDNGHTKTTKLISKTCWLMVTSIPFYSSNYLTITKGQELQDECSTTNSLED